MENEGKTERDSCLDCREHQPCLYRCKRAGWKGGDTTIVMTLDMLATYCGYFTSDVETNNGYGCSHPEQEEEEESSDGIMEGSCSPISCPIAHQLYPSNEPQDRVYFPDVSDEELDGGGYDNDHMLVCGIFKSVEEEDKSKDATPDGDPVPLVRGATGEARPTGGDSV